MRVSKLAAAGAALAFTVPTVALSAQEDEGPYVYASYYQCSPGQIGPAVQNLRDHWAPVLQRAIDAGDLTTWGVATHTTGNEWSLVLYHVGPDVNRLLGVIDAGVQQLYENTPDEAAAFSESCPSHVDYVWENQMGSASGDEIAAERGEAGMTVYWICDEGTEAVADLIFETTMAPVLNEQVEAGLLTGWSWSEHYLGGEYRRMLATDGPDHASLLEARNNLIEASFNANPGLGAAFSQACNGHQDNLYDIVIVAP